MPQELLGLLEKIVLHSQEFSGFKKLQNLLIITAIQTDRSRVMDYINRLDNYDGQEIAQVALKPEYGLYEEAFVVYGKIKEPIYAVKVLLENLNDVDRAAQFAEKVNVEEVWTELGKNYLENKQFSDAVNSFIKAKNTGYYEELIELNREVGDDEKLLEYFNMVRKTKKIMVIDNEYVYCLSRLDKLDDLEAFIKQANSADLARTGERLYTEGFFKAAKILFMKLKSNSKIASCLVNLG